MRRILLVSIVLLTLGACSPTANCDHPQNGSAPLHVLFIGNSYTFVNNLPDTFARLACSGGHKVETGIAAEGGWTLADHVASPQTMETLNQPTWDFVVLQEQSEIPAIEYYRTQSMYPAARTLVGKIRAMGGRPILFLTWGHREGLPSDGYPDFYSMQAQLDAGYEGLANELKLPIAPVGYAWLKGTEQSPPLSLWQDDGSHPNEQGTYLAACIFYAVILRQSPLGLSYRAGLSQQATHTLQALAADTVIDRRRWHLP